jgi:hypothetical protein
MYQNFSPRLSIVLMITKPQLIAAPALMRGDLNETTPPITGCPTQCPA